MNNDEEMGSNSRMRRIQRVSSIFRILCVIALAVMLFFAMNLAWFGIQRGAPIGPGTGLGLEEVQISHVTAFSLGRLSLFSDVPVSLSATLFLGWLEFSFIVIGIGLLYRLFGNYERGLIFARQTIRIYRWIAVWLLAGWMITNFLQLLKFWAPGGRLVTVHFSVDEFFFGGLLLLLVSWIMDEGRKLQEEQALTV